MPRQNEGESINTSNLHVPAEFSEQDVLASNRVTESFEVEQDGKITEVDEKTARDLNFGVGDIEDDEKLGKVRTTHVEVVTIEEGSFVVSTIEGYYDMVVKETEWKEDLDEEGKPTGKKMRVDTPQVYRLRRKSVKWRPLAVGPHGLPITVEPVLPAKISPSRARPTQRDHKVIFVASDEQIGYRNINGKLVPIHDERALEATYQLEKYLDPDVVVDTGDTTDFAELSHFQPDSDHFFGTMQPSLVRSHEHFAQMTANSPNARERATVDSNHVERMVKYILNKAPHLYNVRPVGDKYPAFSYPGLLKLDDIGWRWIDGYGAAEYEYNKDLAFIHGTIATSNGSTAQKLSKENYGRNIVQGHAHRMEAQYHTDRDGKIFGAFVVGALCRIDGAVPSFHSAVDEFNQTVKHYENWQQGVMVIHDYGNGNYQFDQVPIHEGVAYYNGKTFDSTKGRTILAA